MNTDTVVASTDAVFPPHLHDEPTANSNSVTDLVRLHLRSRPPRVPADCRSRAVTLVSAHPNSHCRGGPSYQLRKALRCSSPMHHPVHSRGTWEQAYDTEKCVWDEPSAVHLGAHSSRALWLDELRDWLELLNRLSAQHNTAVALGSLRREECREALDGWWLLADKTASRYADTPSNWFMVDLDHVPGEPADVDDVLVDYIGEHMPELGACAFVASFTSKAGIKGARVRLIFELDEPRTLAAMRGYALTVNARAGYEVIDASLYTPGHLVLTAAPRFYAVVANGDALTVNDLPRPVPTRAWHVTGDLASIPDVPEQAASSAAHYTSPNRRGAALSLAAASQLLQQLGPGNYNGNIHNWLCHVAFKTPEHVAESAFAAVMNTIHDRIRETSEPAKLDERLRVHGNPKALRQKWNAARARRNNLKPAIVAAPVAAPLPTPTTLAEARAAVPAAAPPAPQSIADVRAQLLVDFEDAASKLLKGEKWSYLFTHAPGTGKSGCMKLLVTPGRLSSYLTRITVPDHTLARQLVADLKEVARTLTADPVLYGDLVARIRHHKGRSQPGMCPDPVSGPKAARSEALGASPKKTVCPSCATGKAGLCPWLNQDDDQDGGIIVEVHAAAVSKQGERRTDLRIIDEGILGNILQSSADCIDMDKLVHAGVIRKKPNTLGSLGAPIWRASDRLAEMRKLLVAALGAAMPAKEGANAKVTLSAVTELTAPASFKARVGKKLEQRDGTGVDEAIELETQLQASLVREIVSKEAVGKDAAALLTQLRASQAAGRVYGAIAASHRCQREYVFGLAAFWQKVKGKRQNQLKLVTRALDVSHLFGEASITLDGTADASVWRAIVAPNGAAFDATVLRADPIIPAGALHAVQYPDKAGAKSSFRTSLALTEQEQVNISKRDALANAPAWWKFTGQPGELESQLALADAQVQSDKLKRDNRKLRCDSNLDLVLRFVAYKAAEHAARAVPVDGRHVSVLLVAQKDVECDLRKLGLPDNVATIHFGALRGLNAFQRVPVVVVVGRSRPANIDLELATEALHMHNAAVRDIGRHEVLSARDWQEGHPDPLVAAVQAAITGAEVKQAVARGRLFDRTPAAPAEVHVFGVYNTGIPEAQIQRAFWSDAERSPVEIALARGAVFLDTRLNRRAYGVLFPKGNAAGDGKNDRVVRRAFDGLVGNLAREFGRAVESRPYPNREVEGQSPGSLLGLGTGFAPGVTGDALSHAWDGSDAVPGRHHKLVRLRTPASRKGSFALVDARWGNADVERLLRCPVTAWTELPAERVKGGCGCLVAGTATGSATSCEGPIELVMKPVDNSAGGSHPAV